MSHLEEQLQEFESIQSIYDTEKLRFDQKLIDKLVEPPADQWVQCFNVKRMNDKYKQQSISESSTCHAIDTIPPLRFSFEITKHILIDCCFPATYPISTAPQLFVRSTSSQHSKSSIDDANHLLRARIGQEFEPGNQCIFDLFDWIDQNIPSVITVANFSSNSSKSKMVKSMNLQRTFMWFHHIYSSVKKRNINQLARQHKLNGFCVTGKPGVIVVEGMDKNVNEYVMELKVESIGTIHTVSFNVYYFVYEI